MPVRKSQLTIIKPLFINALVIECKGYNSSLWGIKHSRHCSEIEEKIRDDLREMTSGSSTSLESANAVKISVKYEYSAGSFWDVLLSGFTFSLIPHKGTYNTLLEITTENAKENQKKAWKKNMFAVHPFCFFHLCSVKDKEKY